MTNDERTTDERRDDARGEIGASATLTRALSEADLALFALVMGEVDLTTPPPMRAAQPEPAEMEEVEEQTAERAPQAAPPALLAALLTTVAAQLSDHPTRARILEMRLLAPAYAGETLIARATVTGHEVATGDRQITARCETLEGRHLAEADLLTSGDQPSDQPSAPAAH